MKIKKFTLIELLIVVSILAILAALLLPVLSKAKKRARLASCVNNLHQTALGVVIYADDNDGFYPKRTHQFKNGHAMPYILVSNYGVDDRPILKDYLETGLSQCPFTANIDPFGVADNADYSIIDYRWYFGWDPQLNNSGDADPGDTMRKPGDKMVYDGNEFDIIAADRDHVYTNGGPRALSSHPDSLGLMTERIANSDTKRSSAFKSDVAERGVVDLNYARSDGSVFRIDNVEYDDDRLTKLPYKAWNSGGVGSKWSQLPDVDY